MADVQPFPEPVPEPPPARARKPIAVVAFSLGWVLIAGSTAGAVVAFGKTGASSKSQAAGIAPPRSAHASVTPTFAPSPSSAAPSTTAPAKTTPPTTPTPVSTVTGSVSSGLIHTGDLRFFLLPVPSDGSVVGNADGSTLTKDQIAADYKDSSSVVTILGQLGFKDGADREYQTGDAAYHVEVRLLRFDSQQDASLWFQGDQPDSKWKEFSISGYSDAKGWDIAPSSPGGLGRLRGLYYRGDTVFEVMVTGQDPVDHSVLVDRMGKQIDRLTTGA